MTCEEAARALHAGLSAEAGSPPGTEGSAEADQTSPELEVHVSACEDCRALAEDLAQLGRAFARARAEWAPSADFRVRLPAAPWRKLAIAASLLLLPLASWAYVSLEKAQPPGRDVGLLLEPRQAARPTDREVLGLIFLQEGQP